MRKHQQQIRFGSGLAAISLSCALFAFGCTTNRTPGNGEPGSTMPMTSPSSPASTPGSSGTSVNPPMSSSYAAPLSRADAAAAIMARHQTARTTMRYLGPANPALRGPELSSQQVTGQMIPPSYAANPQLTVNSSISSQPTEVISSGTPITGAAQSVTVAPPVIATTQALTTPTFSSSTSPVRLVTSPNGGVTITNQRKQ